MAELGSQAYELQHLGLVTLGYSVFEATAIMAAQVNPRLARRALEMCQRECPPGLASSYAAYLLGVVADAPASSDPSAPVAQADRA